MKNFKTILLICFSVQLIAQNKMEINDPQWWWSSNEASVDNIIISVEPTGMYAEVKMEFDVFSSDNYYFDPDGQLEFVFDFIMDDDIVFNDSWLWINDYISKGEIYELNEGTQIYEDIVNRRQDPSILTKISSNSYNLKIYPLLGDSTRRVMLSYLSPLDFNQGEASLNLPMDIFKVSAETPQNTSVIITDSEHWLHYEPQGPFTKVSEQGNSNEYYIYDFQSLVDSKISFMSTDYSSDYYFGVYSDSTDNYFQMVYFPDIETSQSSTYHFIVLDYDERNVQDNYSQEYILSTLEVQLTSILGPNDYFNICYSNFVTDFARDTWTPATRENIENVFSELRTQGYSDISKLEVLLPEALNFVNNNHEKSELTILSSGTNFTRQEEAEAFLDYLSDFIEDMTVEVDISVVDFANGYRPSDWINNQLFRGNEYFYNLLTSANSGLHYSSLYGDTPGEALSQILVSQSDLITEFDLDLDPANGFTYSNYMNTFNLNAFVNNAPLMITGKFIGTFPFELALKGISNNTIFEHSFVIPQSRAFTLNDKASKIWHGQFILNNEFNNNNQITADVIDISREKRLLSAKTIFLCLEPDTISISSANTNNENDWVVSTEEPQNNTAKIKVYPNPFVERLTIEIPFDGNQDEIRIQIFNSLGSEVLVKNLEKKFNAEQLILTWDSDESLKAGIYFIHIQSDGINEIRKVIYAGR